MIESQGIDKIQGDAKFSTASARHQKPLTWTRSASSCNSPCAGAPPETQRENSFLPCHPLPIGANLHSRPRRLMFFIAMTLEYFPNTARGFQPDLLGSF